MDIISIERITNNEAIPIGFIPIVILSIGSIGQQRFAQTQKNNCQQYPPP